jgi:hypothetical protein
VDQLDAHRAPERLGDLFALALAHQPGVDVHAGELVADRPVHERGGDRRVDAAGERADRSAGADLGSDARHLLVDDRRHRPVARESGALVEESSQHAHAVRRVHDLRVELHAVELPGVILEHGHRRVVGGGGRGETRGRRGDRVEVAHPDVVDVGRVVGQQQRRRVATQLGAAVLAAHPAADGAAELLGDELGAVADAEDRHPQDVDLRVERRCAVDVNALRATGQDQRRRFAGPHLLGRDPVGHDLRVHLQLPHPAGDELGVLSTEVDDQDCHGRTALQGLDRRGRW